jgi:hypothetical protein
MPEMSEMSEPAILRSERPETIEIAISPEGNVILNYKDLPLGPDGWGHLTFTVPEAMALTTALSEATHAAWELSQLPKES